VELFQSLRTGTAISRKDWNPTGLVGTAISIN